MRMPRPRFSVRGLMAAVAIAGVVFGAWTLRDSARRRMKIARDYASSERSNRRAIPLYAACADEFEAAAVQLEEAGAHDQARLKRLAARGMRNVAEGTADQARYYSAMRVHYERAARYPWLPLAPDPPRPKYRLRRETRTLSPDPPVPDFRFALVAPYLAISCIPCVLYLGREVRRSPKSTRGNRRDQPVSRATFKTSRDGRQSSRA
jgi:hypothetical protein